VWGISKGICEEQLGYILWKELQRKYDFLKLVICFETPRPRWRVLPPLGQSSGGVPWGVLWGSPLEGSPGGVLWGGPLGESSGGVLWGSPVGEVPWGSPGENLMYSIRWIVASIPPPCTSQFLYVTGYAPKAVLHQLPVLPAIVRGDVWHS
jgi:hypothetical protein